MKNSRISWTDHTWNPWWGCEKVSPACDSCYAETFARRVGKHVWGPDAPRRFFGLKHWSQPLKWNREAKKAGKPALVFCASMADVFEDREDLQPWRERLWELIDATPDLRWLLLTKRADKMFHMLPPRWIIGPREKLKGRNVWLGVTAENQRRADERIPHLFSVPASLYWVSAEPLLGPIDFSQYGSYEVETGQTSGAYVHGLDWIIVGGESGFRARMMDRRWVRSIRRQCRKMGIKYHFKQKGDALAKQLGCQDRSGRDPSEWPREFRVQEFPKIA